MGGSSNLKLGQNEVELFFMSTAEKFILPIGYHLKSLDLCYLNEYEQISLYKDEMSSPEQIRFKFLTSLISIKSLWVPEPKIGISFTILRESRAF